MKLRNLIFTLAALVVVFSSCNKEDEVEPVIEETLDNAYIQSVKLINIPPYYWDNGSSPDLQLKLAKETSETWTYVTNRKYDVEEVPQVLSFDNDVPVTNENWEFQLIDYDDLNSDDIIYHLKFNPTEQNFENGVIPIYYNDLLILEFNYIK